MKKYSGTRYNSRWNGSSWAIVGLVAVCCIVPSFMDDGIWPTIICLVMLAFVFVTFISIYYRIAGNQLVVYQFFIPTAYPIDKIKSIKLTKKHSVGSCHLAHSSNRYHLHRPQGAEKFHASHYLLSPSGGIHRATPQHQSQY